jgi:hypothetical protein
MTKQRWNDQGRFVSKRAWVAMFCAVTMGLHRRCVSH